MNPMETLQPFNEQEKRFVLAEAIKQSSIPVDRLLNVLNDGNHQPAWDLMLLPNGRNLKSCMETFEALRAVQHNHFQNQSYQISIPPDHKRKSGTELLDPSSATPRDSKRRQSGMDIITARDIRPKPSHGSSSFNSPLQPAPPKKRGRPSKATVEQRNAEAIARGEVIAPVKVATSKSETQVGGEFAATPGYAAIAPMVSPRPVPSPITPAVFESQRFVSPPLVSPEKKKQPQPRSRSPKAPQPGEGSFPAVNPHIGQPERSAEQSASASKETTSIPHGEVNTPQPAFQSSQTIVAHTQAPAQILSRSDVV